MDPEPGEICAIEQDECFVRKKRGREVPTPSCLAAPRAVSGWGPVPREAAPLPKCPVHPRLVGDGVVAETISMQSAFDPLPWDEEVPDRYLVGTRRVIEVEDGFLIAYSAGILFWSSEDGRERRTISTARVIGFSRAESGKVLALAIGRARLGRGGVLALERVARGEYVPRLIAALPLEPQGVVLDDHGVIVGVADSFLFRVDETGRVENVHYLARGFGRIASIAKAESGVYYLGVECGIVRLVPDGETYREEFWSLRGGASGRWSSCSDS